mmetsp:Transcript_733/g.1395  ORF Transcript_733/g.1395 Transcript_733/m.1395 type:complete len:1363 (+) Transcript_733:131-4219(+)
MELSGKRDGRSFQPMQSGGLGPGPPCERPHVERRRAAPAALALFAAALAMQTSAISVVPQAGDPSPFVKVGGGECLAPASRSVRGRSRRDLSHPACRGLCDDTCLGYTYAPCERVCTLHGDPSKLNNTPEAEGWTTVNGGGKIDSSSRRCGSNCYIRMGPCASGNMASNGAAVFAAAMPYGASRTAVCPHPFVGTLQLRCTLEGPIIEAGRCRSPCEPSMVLDGNFEVYYPQMLHGLETASPCPQGANGAIVMACLDGQASRVSGRCGYNCVTGSLRVGDAAVAYPFLVHEDVVDLKCPNGTSGMVRLECVDSRIYVMQGMCKADCDASSLPLALGQPGGFITYGAIDYPDLNNTDEIRLPCAPSNNFTNNVTLRCYRGEVTIVEGVCRRHCLEGSIGPGVKAVDRPRLLDMSRVVLSCNEGFTGDLELECDDGNVTLLSGECMMHCAANTVMSNGVELHHPNMTHNSTMNITCPAGYTGFVDVTCFDGRRTFVGFCGLDCTAGQVHSNTAYVSHTALASGSAENFTCPVGPPTYIGTLEIRCYDGSIRHDAGWCGRPCNAGQKRQGGAVVDFISLNHSQAMAFPCVSMYPGSLTFSGDLTVSCWDSKVTYVGDCFADCPSGRLRWMGAQVLYPNMKNGEIADVPCQPDESFGLVQVLCLAGFGQIDTGTCGVPCEPNDYSGALTSFTNTPHPRIGHNSSAWVICPPQLSGNVLLYCMTGVVTAINGSCGNRCRSEYMDVYGASFKTPLMEHRAVLEIDCQGGYNGVVSISCDFGRKTVSNGCRRPCTAGQMTLQSGATIDFPALLSGVTSLRGCPEGYVGDTTYGGAVVLCTDGNVGVDKGGCYMHCAADWFWDPYHTETWRESWSVQHYEILHDTEQARACPEGYSGRITLGCFNGVVTLKAGDCFQDCAPGRAFIRAGVVVRYMNTPNGASGPRTPCPAGFNGNIRLRCNEGVMSLDEGGCNRTCPMSFIATAPHGELNDAEEATLACPDTGTLDVRCSDGSVSVLGGHCIHRCPAGTITDGNGTIIQYGEIAHNETAGGACIGYATGIVTLLCNDTVVSIEPRMGEQCFRHCRAGPVHTSDGQVIMAPNTEHGNRNSAKCPAGLVGIITVRCYDSILSVYDGSCGPANCPSGTVYSNGAAVEHGEINDGWKAGPYQCAAPYTGVATTFCRNGTTEINDVTLQVPSIIEDLENTSNKEESLFTLCGCCAEMGEPDPAPPVKSEDTGVYLWLAITIGASGVLLAILAGWYFLPRRGKISRVYPDGGLSPDHPLVKAFQLELQQNPKLQRMVLQQKLQALPAPQQREILSKMLVDARVVTDYYDLPQLQELPFPQPTQLAIADTAPKAIKNRPPQLALNNG